MQKQRLVIFSGAGMSAESGLSTFRDSDGLWEKHRVTDVATPEAWQRDPALVLRFYNERRRQIVQAEPNDAHHALVRLEERFDVCIITQNIDDLHERAGSKHVIHLHGEIFKAKTSEFDTDYVTVRSDMHLGQFDRNGLQLRPHVVWFGESVPEFDRAVRIMARAEIALVIGTSLKVYPAASLVQIAPRHSPVYIIDPAGMDNYGETNYRVIKDRAVSAVPNLVETLLRNTTLPIKKTAL